MKKVGKGREGERKRREHGEKHEVEDREREGGREGGSGWYRKN